MNRTFAVAALFLTAAAAAWINISARNAFLRGVTEAERVATAGSTATPPSHAEKLSTVYAHRAAIAAKFKDNSAEGISAARDKYPAIEMDVFFEPDGTPYVGHNVHADPVHKLRLDTFTHRDLDSFEAVLIDVKWDGRDAAGRASRFCAALPRTSRARITVLGMSGKVLAYIHRRRPDLGIACESYLPLAAKLAGFTAVSLDIRDVNAARDAIARRLGLERIYWTAFDRAGIAKIAAWQPEAMIVNYRHGLRVEDARR